MSEEGRPFGYIPVAERIFTYQEARSPSRYPRGSFHIPCVTSQFDIQNQHAAAPLSQATAFLPEKLGGSLTMTAREQPVILVMA